MRSPRFPFPVLLQNIAFDGNAVDGFGTRNGIVYGAIPTSGHVGGVSTALEFNGISDYVELTADIWVAGDFSVSGWVNMYSYGSWERFFEFGNGIDVDNVFFALTQGALPGSNRPVVGLHQCGSLARSYTVAPAPLLLNTWYHMVVTLSANTVSVYRNDVLWYSGLSPYPPCAVVRNMCYFGKSNYPSNTHFHGKLDDFTIFNRAITPGEVYQLYVAQGCGHITMRITGEAIPVATGQKAGLAQNTPNPFIGATETKYELSEETKAASLDVYDLSGRMVKIIQLPVHVSSGAVTLDSKDFTPGIYTYGINIDGRVIARKKMVLAAQ